MRNSTYVALPSTIITVTHKKHLWSIDHRHLSSKGKNKEPTRVANKRWNRCVYRNTDRWLMKRKEEGSKEMVPMGMDLWPPEIPRNESSFSMICPATTSPHQKEINTLLWNITQQPFQAGGLLWMGCMLSTTLTGKPSQRWQWERKWSWREELDKKTTEKRESARGEEDEGKKRGRERT